MSGCHCTKQSEPRCRSRSATDRVAAHQKRKTASNSFMSIHGDDPSRLYGNSFRWSKRILFGDEYRALGLLEFQNELHIIWQLVKLTADAVQTESTLNTCGHDGIPTNQSFEIIEFPIKRTIPLYELPISAGVGNQCFDGVPFTDYETDHPTCDFALRISGNSMEPRLKDSFFRQFAL